VCDDEMAGRGCYKEKDTRFSKMIIFKIHTLGIYVVPAFSFGLDAI